MNKVFERKLTTGCPIIDEFCKGGLAAGQVVEIYGPSQTGKSTFGLQLLLNVQLGYDQGGLEGGALYICTTGRFCCKRLDLIFESFLQTHINSSVSSPASSTDSGFTSSKNKRDIDVERLRKVFYDRIHVLHIRDLETQTHFLQYKIPQHMKQHNLKLLVLDSIAGNFRVPQDGASIDTQRAKAIFETGDAFRKIASSMGAVVVCINEVSAKFERHDIKVAHDSHGLSFPLSEPSDGCDFVPSLGVALSVIVNTRIRFQRNAINGNRSMHVVFSPYLPAKRECVYSLMSEGLRGNDEDGNFYS